MAQMILKGKEMIRINPTTKTKIEYSTNDGRSWMARSTSASYGDFSDLTDNAKEIVGMELLMERRGEEYTPYPVNGIEEILAFGEEIEEVKEKVELEENVFPMVPSGDSVSNIRLE